MEAHDVFPNVFKQECPNWVDAKDFLTSYWPTHQFDYQTTLKWNTTIIRFLTLTKC